VTPNLCEGATCTGRSRREEGAGKTAEPRCERREVHMRPNVLFAAFLGTLVATSGQQGAPAQGGNLDTAATTGLKGQLIPESNVIKVTKPRTDVKITVDQWTRPPFMGLGSWAAFTPAHGGTMLMGDTVVFADEVNPAMRAAFDAGLEVTAPHNHFFFDE